MTRLLIKHSTAIGLGILAAGSAMVAATLTLKVLNGWAGAVETLSDDGLFEVVQLAFIVVGAITVARRPENRVSWLFAWVGIFLTLSELSSQYATYAYDSGSFLAAAAAWFSYWVWVPAFGPIATLLLLWFPTGRIPSPRWRFVERFAFGLIAVTGTFAMIAEDPESTVPFPNPLEMPWATALVERVFVVMGPMFPLLVAASAFSLIVRFRRSRGEERQQLKWFVLAAAMLPVYMTADTFFGGFVPDVVGGAAFLSIPAAAGIAILKYRLFDIDVVINRTLVYLSLTALLVGAYLGVVLLLQQVFSGVTVDSDIAVAASTLVVAALFRPLRSKVQRFIDRRFYRHKYDAAEKLSLFSSRLRDQVDLDSVNAQLLEVMSETVAPTHASLWLRPRSGS
ncbi:MAG: hypothetical protein ACR2KQ_02915 [Actinomycetota bacterium]